MSAVLLARIQFAMTIGFHFLFPPISIGLAWMVVAMETIGWRKNDPVWSRMGAFFGKLLGLTFAVGVATGVVMEFQFGTNWAAYSRFVGDIFGAPLAAEGVFAFFLESTFLGLYLFGRNKVSRGVHWFSALMVAFGSTMSAFWILIANSWQQTPAGCAIEVAGTGQLIPCAQAMAERLSVDGRAVLTNFSSAVFSPSMWNRFFHTINASLITGAFFVAGVAALMMIRGQSRELSSKALKMAVAAGFVVSIIAAFPSGHEHAKQVARDQPEKFAAMEGLYATEDGAPLIFFALPSANPPDLKATIAIPGMVSWMVFGDPDQPIPGLDQMKKDEIPPLWLTFVSFHNMVMLGLLFQAVTLLGLFLWWRKRIDTTRWYHVLLLAVSWLPLAANQFGWVTAEVGRQPWSVYRLLRVTDSVSATVGAGEILFSIILLGFIYTILLALYLFLLIKFIKQGPAPVEEVA